MACGQSPPHSAPQGHELAYEAAAGSRRRRMVVGGRRLRKVRGAMPCHQEVGEGKEVGEEIATICVHISAQQVVKVMLLCHCEKWREKQKWFPFNCTGDNSN